MKRIAIIVAIAALSQGCSSPLSFRAQAPSLMSSQVATYRLNDVENMSREDLGTLTSSDCVSGLYGEHLSQVDSSGAIEKLKAEAYRRGANAVSPPVCRARFDTGSCQQELSCSAQAWHVEQLTGPNPVKDAPNSLDAMFNKPITKRFHLPQSATGGQ